MARPTVTISSNTLFHFTNSLGDLLRILREEFRPHYSLEDLKLLPGAAPESPEVAFPMVCFCDIPLSQTADHLRTYGRYGIGLRKSWGKTHRISPVLYAYPGSATAAAVNRVGRIIRRLLGKNANPSSRAIGGEALNHLLRLVSFVKPYEGRLWREGRYTRPIRFYNEREWRYVPSFRQPGAGNGYLLKSDFLDTGKRSEANHSVPSHTVAFQPSDIRYLIVDQERDILETSRRLRAIKSPKYNDDDVEMLLTRIISAEQIAEDF